MRTVSVEKAAGQRTYVDVRQQGRNTVVVHAVAQASPFAGLLVPGDVIARLDGQPATSAEKVAAMLVKGSRLTLEVTAEHESEIRFLPVGLMLDLTKDKPSGLLRVLDTRFDKAAARGDLESGGPPYDDEAIEPGDLLLAVCAADGVLKQVDTPSAAISLLHEAQGAAGQHGLVEVRIVRNPAAARPPPFAPCDATGMPPLAVKPATRAVAINAVRRSHDHGETRSGATSPTTSGDSSDGEHGGGGGGAPRAAVEGTAWRSMEQRLRTRCPQQPLLRRASYDAHEARGRAAADVDGLAAATPRMLRVGFLA